MKKEALVRENEILTHENKLLKLKLEQEEIYNSIERYKLTKELEEHKSHLDKIQGNTHAIGFHALDDEYFYTEEESSGISPSKEV